MLKMKAIILAAGKGTRLGKYTKNLPKCMLRFNGKSLLQMQVDTLRSCGIKDITIVKGFMQDKIKIGGVKYYVNEDYENTNMVETLMCAEKEMHGGFLVCYGDILYEKKVIKKILEDKSSIGVAVDSDYWAYWKARLGNPEKDTESLLIKNGRIAELGAPTSKKEDIKFRYVGLVKFSKKRAAVLKMIYHRNRKKYFDKDVKWMNSKSFKKAYMTCMLNAIIKSGYIINPVIIQNGWLEFDTREDYEKYNKWHKNGTLGRFFNLKNI